MKKRIETLIKHDVEDPTLAGKLLVAGTVLPTNGDSGYATGCLFQKTDGGNGSALYVNEGTVVSSAFNLIVVT